MDLPNDPLPSARELRDPLRQPLIPARPTPRSLVWRLSIGTAGALVFAAGIVLGPIPVVPGFPLAIVGALMLAASSESARNLINRLETRLPAAARRGLRRVVKGSPANAPADGSR